MNYYYSSDGIQVLGPCPLDKLLAGYRNGTLPDSTQVCAEGHQDWQPIQALIRSVPRAPQRPQQPQHSAGSTATVQQDSTEQTPREKWAMYLAMCAVGIPSLIVSGFLPESLKSVLPFAGWLAIAVIGTALAAAIMKPYCFRSILSGALVGAGALLGILFYVKLRIHFTGNATFFWLELMIGAVIGAVPGILLYYYKTDTPSS